MSKTIHFILQTKGGVGKSIIANYLLQYLAQSSKTLGIDTDPLNKTLSTFKALNIKAVHIVEDEKINERQFDKMIEHIISTDAENIVIDTGSSGYIAMLNYIQENKVIDYLHQQDFRVYFHSIIAGSDMTVDTVQGCLDLADKTDHARLIVLWMNAHFGKAEINENGTVKAVMDSDSIQKLMDENMIHAIINLKQHTGSTFGEDISNMIGRRQTFDIAIAAKETQIMEKQRLKMMRDEIFQSIEMAQLG